MSSSTVRGRAREREWGKTPVSPTRPEQIAGSIAAAVQRGNRALAIELYRRYAQARAPGEALDEAVLGAYRAALQEPSPAPSADDRSFPAPATPFFPRDDDVNAVLSALEKPGAVVTVVGPAGVGKTRLALEAMRLLRCRGDEPARHVAVRLEAEARRALENLGAESEPPERVLVDDAEIAPEAVRAALLALRARVPATRVLVTSRIPLGIAGEIVLPLAPLASPRAGATTAAVARAPAVAFLVERCASLGHDVRVDASTADDLATLTFALGGLPLALELAAAEMRFFGVRDLVGRLRGRGRADASAALHAMVANAVGLLDPGERRIFERLAAFEAPFAIAEAEAVAAGRRVRAAAIAPTLIRLVTRALVTTETRDGTVRYRFLGATRAYALQHADAAELRRVQRRGARWYLGWMRANDPDGLTDPQLDRLLDERLDNVRTALDVWCANPREALAAIAATRTYWSGGGHCAEMLERIAALRARAGALDARLDYRLERCTALFAARTGDRAATQRAVDRAVALAVALGDARARIDALNPAVIVAYNAGDNAEARRLLEECIAYYAAHGPVSEWARATGNLAVVESSLGDYAAAQRCYDAIREVPQDAAGEICYWRNRAWTAVAAGEMIVARAFADEARKLANRPGVPDFYIAETGIMDALVCARSGSAHRALVLLHDVVATNRAQRYPSLVPGLLQCAMLVAHGLGRPAESARFAGAFPVALRRAGVAEDASIAPFRVAADTWARSTLGERRWSEERAVGASLSPERIVEQVLALSAGGPPGAPLDVLSRREREIADLVGDGRTNREIAAALNIQMKTVENHLAAMFVKLGIGRRAHSPPSSRGWDADPSARMELFP